MPPDTADSAGGDSVRLRRAQYETDGIDLADIAPDPIEQWRRWYDQAEQAGCVEPNAMVIGTVDGDGMPDSRYVLARGVTADGFDFYTNYDSAKSQQLIHSPKASGLFTWLQLHRQLRVRGTVTQLGPAMSDDYFASRPRSSQIGAWASPQSLVLSNRSELDQLVHEIELRFQDRPVPRPPNWGGWRLGVEQLELWQGRPSRLHDRLRYRRVEHDWLIERLAP
jgi:pyridoxamine 5'-phosphate oxidase